MSIIVWDYNSKVRVVACHCYKNPGHGFIFFSWDIYKILLEEMTKIFDTLYGVLQVFSMFEGLNINVSELAAAHTPF